MARPDTARVAPRQFGEEKYRARARKESIKSRRKVKMPPTWVDRFEGKAR